MFERKPSEQVSSFLSHQSRQHPRLWTWRGGLTAVWETIILVLYLLHRLVEAKSRAWIQGSDGDSGTLLLLCLASFCPCDHLKRSFFFFLVLLWPPHGFLFIRFKCTDLHLRLANHRCCVKLETQKSIKSPGAQPFAQDIKYPLIFNWS